MDEADDVRDEPLDALLREGAEIRIAARSERAEVLHAELVRRFAEVRGRPVSPAVLSKRAGLAILAAAAVLLVGLALWSTFRGEEPATPPAHLADAGSETPLRIRRGPPPSAEEFPPLTPTNPEQDSTAEPEALPDPALLGEEERARMVREFGLLVQDVAQVTSYLASRVPRVGERRVLH